MECSFTWVRISFNAWESPASSTASLTSIIWTKSIALRNTYIVTAPFFLINQGVRCRSWTLGHRSTATGESIFYLQLTKSPPRVSLRPPWIAITLAWIDEDHPINSKTSHSKVMELTIGLKQSLSTQDKVWDYMWGWIQIQWCISLQKEWY